jgi:hypothetical protein
LPAAPEVAVPVVLRADPLVLVAHSVADPAARVVVPDQTPLVVLRVYQMMVGAQPQGQMVVDPSPGSEGRDSAQATDPGLAAANKINKLIPISQAINNSPSGSVRKLDSPRTRLQSRQ